MNDQFDKKLVNRINEVFDNFEDDSVNEGWIELRKRIAGKSTRRRAVWWFSSAAAALLICGFWLFSDHQTIENEHIAKKDQPAKNNAEAMALPLKEETIKKSLQKNSTRIESHLEIVNSNIVRAKQVQKELAKEQPEVSQVFEQPNELLKEESENNLALIALVPNKAIIADSTSLTTLPVDEKPNTSLHASNTSNLNTVPEEPSAGITDKKLSESTSLQKKKKDPKSEKILTLGFFAGSYFNYAEGSKTSFNTGVGLSSEIKISKKLKISTGVSLAQNSLKYDQLIPQEAAMSFNSSGNKAQFDVLYNSSSLVASSVSYSINSYNAKLTGLDIPINLKYILLEKKSTVYLISGFSSNFFFNESYTYAFDYQMNGNSILNVPNQESSSNFQTFDFAKVLNLSMGIDHQLKNKNTLSLEPFIKYPLSGLGAHDLKFGAAGINLKLNFNRLK